MSLKFDGPVLLAGAGKMGAAMLSGWLAQGLSPADVIIQEPSLAGEAAELACIQVWLARSKRQVSPMGQGP